MAKEVSKGEADQAGASSAERWTHDRVIGEHQQYFIKRLLKLDDYLLQEVLLQKIITKKVSAYIATLDREEAYEYFIAVVKKKKVSKFIKFLEVLETTFSSNEGHKTLVSTMSEHLLLIPDLNEAEKGIVERVVRSAQEIGSEVSVGQTDIRGGGWLVAGAQTVIESEAKVMTPTQSQLSQPTIESISLAKQTQLSYSQLVSGDTHQEPPLTQQMPGYTGSTTGTTEGQTVGRATESLQVAEERISMKITRMNVADTVTVNPPRGFIEPRHIEFFSHKNLVNNVWTFHSVEHGVLISIHREAVPSNIDTFALTMHAYLWGNFDIPEEYEICTAIVVLQVHPKFNFCKSVTLKIPHSVLVDEDDQPEDFVILRAPDPGYFIHSDTHTPTPSHLHQPIPACTQTTVQPDYKVTADTSTNVDPIYTFIDVISDADYSEDYYVQVNLDHFSACVGAKKKRRYRQRKGSLPLNRQGSFNKQRRERKRAMKERIQKLEKGDSIGSSCHLSCDDSFDKQSSLTLRQGSSAESDRPFSRQLQRQGGIDLLLQGSSTDEDTFNNEIIICCCGQEQSAANWTTRFMVAPNTSTGMQALKNSARMFIKNQCLADVEPLECIVTPLESSWYIGFEPDEWRDSDWIVKATTTPQIHHSQVCRCGGPGVQPPHIDFDIRSIHQRCLAPLNMKIVVTGAKINGREPYFTIKSTERHVKYRSDVIHTQSWLYQNDSRILHALKNASNIVLDPCEPDHCKLLADIAFQIPNRVYEHLLREFGFSEALCDQLEAAEKRNLPECVYRALNAYIGEKEERQSLHDLKSILANVGIADIRLCQTNITVFSIYPELCDIKCDRELCMKVAESSPGTQWRFVGRYLGLSKASIDGKLALVDRDSEEEAVIQMLREWKQQFGKDANMVALAKAIYRVKQLHLDQLWWCFLNITLGRDID